MSRLMALLGIALSSAGCAGMPHRELGLAEVRSLAAVEIRHWGSGFTTYEDMTIEKTPEGWHVEAPSTCPDGVADASSVADANQSIDEIEGTTILCAGGGASLFYDKEGTLLKVIWWQ